MMKPFCFSLLVLVTLLAAACMPTTSAPVASPEVTSLVPASEAATPPPAPSPSPGATATPVVAPDTTAEIDCSDVAPFALGCLDQPRPPELAPDVAFIGILPAGRVTIAAWSPDGTRVAYAVVNPDGWSGVEVRQAPEFGLLGRWEANFVSDLTWTPDGRAVLFIFDRGDTTSIGLARLGETDWRDLLSGEKAVLAVSLGKNFVAWLGENLLAFRVHCGTGCETLYALDMATGKLSPLVNKWDDPDAPYADVFATVYVFSPDQRWLAVTDLGRGLPMAMVLEWPGPAEPLDLSARLDALYTEAESWTDGSLAFVAYPPGEPDNWPLPPRPGLYVWNAETGAIRLVGLGAFRALFAPTGDRLAVLFVGEPRLNEEGQIESDGSTPHLGLLNWPEGRLLSVHPMSAEGVSDVFDLFMFDFMFDLSRPIWSPQGQALVFQPAAGGLMLMGRDGNEWPVLTGKGVNWAGWGARGNLALLVDDQIWLVRVPAGGIDTSIDTVLGMVFDIPTKSEVDGFQGVEAQCGRAVLFGVRGHIVGPSISSWSKSHLF